MSIQSTSSSPIGSTGIPQADKKQPTFLEKLVNTVGISSIKVSANAAKEQTAKAIETNHHVEEIDKKVHETTGLPISTKPVFIEGSGILIEVLSEKAQEKISQTGTSNKSVQDEIKEMGYEFGHKTADRLAEKGKEAVDKNAQEWLKTSDNPLLQEKTIRIRDKEVKIAPKTLLSAGIEMLSTTALDRTKKKNEHAFSKESNTKENEDRDGGILTDLNKNILDYALDKTKEAADKRVENQINKSENPLLKDKKNTNLWQRDYIFHKTNFQRSLFSRFSNNIRSSQKKWA